AFPAGRSAERHARPAGGFPESGGENAMSLPARPSARRPRLGFLGTGWIGRNRLKALADSGIAEIAAIAEPSPECLREASDLAPEATQVGALEELMQEPLDGIVIATPSALHADQAMTALAHGFAVFCQK